MRPWVQPLIMGCGFSGVDPFMCPDQGREKWCVAARFSGGLGRVRAEAVGALGARFETGPPVAQFGDGVFGRAIQPHHFVQPGHLKKEFDIGLALRQCDRSASGAGVLMQGYDPAKAARVHVLDVTQFDNHAICVTQIYQMAEIEHERGDIRARAFDTAWACDQYPAVPLDLVCLLIHGQSLLREHSLKLISA
jgi:hypothetical protein